MKIKSIIIENFKNIEKIELREIPNFVVIVGENGVGKTSIFDAISFLKSRIGPYSHREQEWWNSRLLLHNLVKVGKDELKIELEIESTTDVEKQITGNNVAKAGYHLKINSDTTIQENRINEHSASVLLSSWRKKEWVGAIEYIPANRIFNEGQLQLQSQPQNEEEILYSRTSQLQNKYHTAKQSFVNFAVHDELKKDQPKVFPDVKQLIETLLGKEVKIDFDDNLMPKILFKVDSGFVDIDTLSSGQRELFMTYVGIHSTRLSNSVILFDEPDLHLHAILQKEVLKYLKKMSQNGNQIFLTTHALEMISETPVENLFHLSSFTSNSQLIPLKKEKEKLNVFKKLGATKYTFVNFRKTVFLEGPSDYDIIHTASPPELGLRFEVIDGISKATPDILDEASQVESFFMINDRDFLSDSDVVERESKYKNKIKYLKRRHIENYILDSDEFYEIYKKYGNAKYNSKEDFITHLISISKKQIEQTIVDCFLIRHQGNTYPPRIMVKDSESAENALNSAFSQTASRLQSHISDIPTRINSIRTELNSNWDNKWLEYASGKDILKEVGNQDFTPSKSMENIRELVSTKWDENKLPPEILDILITISKHN